MARAVAFRLGFLLSYRARLAPTGCTAAAFYENEEIGPRTNAAAISSEEHGKALMRAHNAAVDSAFGMLCAEKWDRNQHISCSLKTFRASARLAQKHLAERRGYKRRRLAYAGSSMAR